MVQWLSQYRWMVPHSVRMTTASTAAFAAAHALGLPEGVSATVTAMVVTQSNLGGSLRTAFEQVIGSMLGAAYAIAVALAIRPEEAPSIIAALALALGPLSVLAAHSPGFRIAPITAAIVLLGGAGLQLGPLDPASQRIVGIGLGSGIGLLVSVLILPVRAGQSVIDTADRIVGLMAGQLQALASGGATCHAVLSAQAAETRENLVRLATLVEDATHERRARLAGVPDGHRLLRTLRRVRHDINMLRRAAREAGDDAVHECAAAPWQLAAESAAATLRGIGGILTGKPPPEGIDRLTAEVRNYKAAIEDMRQTGVTHSLSTAEIGRVFGIGFALDQLRRDLEDLIEVAEEASGLRKGFAGVR